MKNFNKFLSLKGISMVGFEAKEQTEKDSLLKDYDLECEKFNQEYEALKEKVSNSVSREDFDTQKEVAKEQGIAMAKLVTAASSTPKAITLNSELKDNQEAIKGLATGTHTKEVVVKALTVRADVGGNTDALELSGIGQLSHAKLTAYDIFNKIPVSDKNTNGTIRYRDWDQATVVRAAAAIAEGAAFPSSTAKWVTKTLTIEKIGDSIGVTEEFMEDADMFAAELSMFLQTNVMLKRNADLVNANGTTPNIKGIVTTVNAFTPVASGITDASTYDLLVKVSEDITKNNGSRFEANFAMMNIVDINAMKLKKDGNNNYVIAPFVSRDGSNVAGMVILEENSIVANTMVVGDRRYARIYERAGLSISRGMVGNQFLEDEETLKIRTRLAFLIKDSDLPGFKKVTSISAALVTLAS